MNKFDFENGKISFLIKKTYLGVGKILWISK